ncbi:MAG: hypothetical protein FWH04_02585 [Oscillospiraceae bacterium]|nr:hypothetical protein [Oscillospiraceae bacterium]
MKIVDVQMALQRPPELTSNRANEMQKSGFNVNMANEIEKYTQEEQARVRQMNESESTRLQLHEDGQNDGEQQQEPEDEEQSAQQEELNRYASERILNLPVDGGKLAKGKSKFDIMA